MREAERALRLALQGAKLVASRLGWHARPDFLIVGAQKAGTTALHEYLSRHPRLVPAKEKELGLFSAQMVRAWGDHRHYPILAPLARAPRDRAALRRALRWYHQEFPVPRPGRGQLFYESTPEYLYFPRAAEKIRAYRSDMKLIVLLRDPVERAYSSWNMHREFSEPGYMQLRDERSFEDAVREELATLGTTVRSAKADYVRRGIYHEQLERYLRHFPASQMLILESRELRRAPAAAVRRVCRFLGVPEIEEQLEYPPVFSGRYVDEMPASARRLLTDFYAPHNARLFELIGRKFDWSESEPAADRLPERGRDAALPYSRVA